MSITTTPTTIITLLTYTFFISLTYTTPTSQNELQSLLEFKKGIHHDPHGKITSTWTPPSGYSILSSFESCPESFFGVFCDPQTNSISAIILDNLNLSGEIKFNTLIQLRLLRNLSLSVNRFTGRIVPQFGSLTSLEHLDLGGNLFGGKVPSRIHDLWGLKYLNLSTNLFSGVYPTGIMNLQQLRVLDLSNNMFQGDVGGLFAELKNVEYVDLSCNSFSGGLPLSSMNMSTLGNTVRHLNLSGNLLTGEFFSSDVMGLFKSLEVLDLGGNRIRGRVPSFGSLFNLKVLNLRNNELFGSLPFELLSNLVPLQVLDLSGNGFFGSIRHINSTTLDILDLSSNKLVGSFPEFSSQSELTTLRISNNILKGSLPSNWNQLSKLSEVDLSINKFTGPIPPALFSLNLVNLNLSQNRFDGAIPFPASRAGKLLAQPVFTPLETLDLSDNSLTGGLSAMIGSMNRLRFLNLAKNDFSGQIPDSLINIHGLETLDLSDNSFEGQLPDKLPADLAVLDLTYNNLSGIVPESLRRFPPSSFHPGNEKLVIPGIGTPNRSPAHLAEQGKHNSSKSRIRLAIILASVGAAVMIAFVLLAYYRAQLHVVNGPSKFDNATNGSDVKVGRFIRPSLFQFHAGSEPPRTSTSFSNDHLLTSNSRSLSGQTEFGIEAVGVTSGTINPIMTSPRQSSPGSPLSCSPRFVEVSEQVTLEVYSPDRFAGELYFLDSSLAFTAEQLSRAPAEVLGRSSHGTSYKATLAGGKMFTVKWLRMGLVKNKKEFSKEVTKIGSLKHPNIVSVRAYYWGTREQEKLILSDYIQGDSLAVHLYEATPRRYSRLSFSQRLKVAIEVARALVFLHDRGICHGNLKPTNILLAGPDFTTQVTDFCLHRLTTPSGISEQILNLGALGYCAPELANASKPMPSFKADVYSLGVILMELLTRKSAGDIISGQSGQVDLADWVRLCDQEGRRMDCIDRDIAGGEQPSKAMNDMMRVSLRCILPVNERPNIQQVFEDLCSISS